MQKTKITLALLATSLVVVALIGVTYAQYVNAQPQNSTYYSQTPTQPYNPNYGYLPPNGTSYYPYQQGYYPYQVPQGSYPYGMGMGRGRCW